MDPSGKDFYSLVCTSKELARFRLGEEEGGGKLEAVASTPSQHELALHSMQFSPWGDLVLLGGVLCFNIICLLYLIFFILYVHSGL
jgi:hypothetical protein